MNFEGGGVSVLGVLMKAGGHQDGDQEPFINPLRVVKQDHEAEGAQHAGDDKEPCQEVDEFSDHWGSSAFLSAVNPRHGVVSGPSKPGECQAQFLFGDLVVAVHVVHVSGPFLWHLLAIFVGIPPDDTGDGGFQGALWPVAHLLNVVRDTVGSHSLSHLMGSECGGPPVCDKRVLTAGHRGRV